MIKVACRVLAAAMLLVPATSFATKVPLPIEGATASINAQVQPEFLVNEGGTPAGDNPSYDLYVRRTRIQLAGQFSNFDFYLNIDNPNFGKFGNFTSRVIVQDARASWAPFGLTGGNVLFVGGGFMQIPLSHYELGSTTNYITADQQTDTVRMPGTPLQAFRDTGLQIRGWAMDKRVGYRFGIWEGYEPIAAACTPTALGGCINPSRNPAFRAFLNLAIIGAEEVGYYYGGSYRWGKDPIVSVSGALNYQSRVLRNAFGSLTDQKMFGAGAYLDYPSGETELVAEATAAFTGSGTGSANTGLGLSGNIGYRWRNIAPYVAYDYFQSTSCDTSGTLTAAQLATCNATVDTADSRNFKVGVNYFLDKTANHVYLEFQVNHGQSQFGPGSITAANAGYVPTTLDPASGTTTRRPFSTNLRYPAYKSLLIHWNLFF